MRLGGLVTLLWAMSMSACFGVGFGAHSCSDMLLTTFTGFTNCQSLPKLGAALAWTINNATNSVDFAFTGR